MSFPSSQEGTTDDSSPYVHTLGKGCRLVPRMVQSGRETLHDDHSHGADAFRYGASPDRVHAGSDPERQGLKIVPDNNSDYDRFQPIVAV